jgi:putative hydrolase of the HAD superfamily
MNCRAVVFDIDDTLYLEREYVRSGFRAVGDYAAERLGIEGFQDTAWALFNGGARGTVFDVALEQLAVEPAPAIVSDLVSVYRAHDPAIELLPDARRTLASLRGQLFTGVISDGPLAAQQRKVEALGLEALVNAIILTDAWGRAFWKPHPRAFHTMAELAGCAAPQCAYVADNPAKDFQAPRALGWRTVRVRLPGGLHASTTARSSDRAELECDSMADVARMLELDLDEEARP